jgi:hypothetical protein
MDKWLEEWTAMGRKYFWKMGKFGSIWLITYI